MAMARLQKSSRAVSSVGHDLARLNEVVQGGPGDVQDLGNGGLRDALAQEPPDVWFLAVKLGGSQGPLGPAEPRSLGLRGGEAFLGPF